VPLFWSRYSIPKDWLCEIIIDSLSEDVDKNKNTKVTNSLLKGVTAW
jgi:hypothetical protein